MPLRRSVEHAVCKVKYDKYMYYKNKLNEHPLSIKYMISNLTMCLITFINAQSSRQQHCLRIVLNDPRTYVNL